MYGTSSNNIVELLLDVPEAPAAPTVSDIFKDNALCNWKPPANDGGSPVTGYTLEKQTGTSSRWVS